jgi:FlaA1/EpsC-like NDP-sugar epimerase
MKDKYGLFKNSDIFSHIITLKYIPRWIVLIVDILACLIAYSIASYFTDHLHGNEIGIRITSSGERYLILMAVQIFFFWLFHTYSGVLRYSGYIDAMKLLFAVFFTVISVLTINFIYSCFGKGLMFFINGLIIYSVISFLFLFLIRLIVKTIFDFLSLNIGKITPVMIYGTNAAAVGIAKMLRSTQVDTKYNLVGFIENDKNASQKFIMGEKVYFLDENTIKKIISKKARAIIVSPLKMKQINTAIDLDVFLNYNLSVLTFPPMGVWNGDMPNIRQIKSIQIEDLLERPTIEILTENIAKSHQSKVVLVTGAAGSIGSEIVRQLVSYNPKLIILLDQAETEMHNMQLDLDKKYPDCNFCYFLGNVRNKERMEYMMDNFRPDFIYHAAAYKHVPLMEENPVESIQTNVVGTKNMADLAVKYKVERFVMISTDKAVNPTNVMGASKRIAEIYVQSLFRKLNSSSKDTTKFITTRFGNVLGSNGSVIPLFKKQIEKGGPITVTHPDIIRYFMTIPEACMLVLEAGVMGNGGEIFIFDMGNPVKIVSLARKMIKLAGYIPDVDIKIEFTGLRPGEKLYEELLNNKEVNIETHNPKIMIAKVQEYEFEEISIQIDELINISAKSKDFLTVAQMKKIVPEFKSKNSQYERLDLK